MMTYFPKRAAIGIMVGALLASPAALAQNATQFGDKLGFVPVNDVNRALVSGTGQVSADLSDSTLSVSGEYEGVGSPVTSVAVHNAPPGVQGPEVETFEVEGSDTSGSFSFEMDLNEEQMQMLQNNALYVVVRTENNENGELRAWLIGDSVSNAVTMSTGQ